MAVRNYGNKPILVGSAVLATPSGDDVLADTGAVAYGGLYTINAIVGATVSAAFTFARRNVANDDDIAGHVFTVLTGANGSAEYVFSLPLEKSERVVVRSEGGNAGNNYVMLNVEQGT